jgi:hypothetical protein
MSLNYKSGNIVLSIKIGNAFQTKSCGKQKRRQRPPPVYHAYKSSFCVSSVNPALPLVDAGGAPPSAGSPSGNLKLFPEIVANSVIQGVSYDWLQL